MNIYEVYIVESGMMTKVRVAGETMLKVVRRFNGQMILRIELVDTSSNIVLEEEPTFLSQVI